MPSERVDQLNQIIMLDLAQELLNNWEQVGNSDIYISKSEIQSKYGFFYSKLLNLVIYLHKLSLKD